MPIKNLTLGLCLIFSSMALAQNQEYRIRQGDTLSGIADRFNVRASTLGSANGLTQKSTLRVGRVITIPRTSKDSARSKSVPNSKGGYVVRNGDHDRSIAKKHGITVGKLHAMNPGVKWRSLQLGQVIRVPGASHVAKSSSTPKVDSPISKTASGLYSVRSGDNDWIIARRYRIKPSDLRKLNPGVNLAKLQIGQRIRVPGAARSETSASVASQPLRSRYAVITKDATGIRRGPSTNSSLITRSASGTRVTVVDREGEWYKLRFPAGTIGWVRGDLLKPTSAPVIAKNISPKNPSEKNSTKKPSVAKRGGGQLVAMNSSGKGSASEILDKAQSMRGVRYRWGASSRSATDCSGFTSQIFKAEGYRIPRTSVEQAKAGKQVARKDLKPGDLVFFRTVRGTRVSHVGIYMGGGKFIHASSGGGKVQVNSLSDPYYNKRYVTGRRVAKGTKGSEGLGEDFVMPPLETVKKAQANAQKPAETTSTAPTDPEPPQTPPDDSN